MHEAGYSLRRLLRSPLVSIAVIVTLAIGVGAATTAWTLVRRVLRPFEQM